MDNLEASYVFLLLVKSRLNSLRWLALFLLSKMGDWENANG